MFWMTSFSAVLRSQELFLVVRENVHVSPRTLRFEVTVVSNLSLDTISIYIVSAEVIIPVVHPPVLLLMKSIPLDTLTRVDHVSPRIHIGSDL